MEVRILHHSEGLAARLLTLRAATGMSVEQAAKKANISPGLLSQLERGVSANPRLSTLTALARVYRCHSLEELFGPLPSQHVLDAVVEREEVG
jgi:transcriptional regulator with XRE-family HTH domain